MTNTFLRTEAVIKTPSIEQTEFVAALKEQISNLESGIRELMIEQQVEDVDNSFAISRKYEALAQIQYELIENERLLERLVRKETKRW